MPVQACIYSYSTSLWLPTFEISITAVLYSYLIFAQNNSLLYCQKQNKLSYFDVIIILRNVQTALLRYRCSQDALMSFLGGECLGSQLKAKLEILVENKSFKKSPLSNYNIKHVLTTKLGVSSTLPKSAFAGKRSL